VVDYWYLLLLFFGLIFILYRILRWSRTTSRFYRLNEALSKRWWNLVFLGGLQALAAPPSTGWPLVLLAPAV